MPSNIKDPMWTTLRDWARDTLGEKGFQAGFSSVASGYAPSQLHIWREPLLIICYPPHDSVVPWTLPNGHGVSSVSEDGELFNDGGHKATTLEEAQAAVTPLIEKYGEVKTQRELCGFGS